ncbi:MAG: type II toxin-antitoxin system PemK/MazF family toxin [Deltaproteobacteria bacterium]|nr:type II toxin-antitoxin system PemK/MazF family toxin [Deltaproteobacteria bacterium]
MQNFPQRGEIYLVRIPNKPKDSKERPALIVSMDVRNQYADDVIAIPLTTNLRAAPTHIRIKKGLGGLKQDSMAKCEQITTLDKSLLIRGPFAGKISESLLSDILKAILNALGAY